MLLESAIRTLRVIEEPPHFKPAALGALLSRQTETLAAVDKVLAGFARMLALAEEKNPERHAAAFEARYRTALEQKLDRVELFGIRAGTKRYPLTVAFVTLEAEREHDDDTAPNEGAVHDVLGGEGDRLWATGLAGAGKTTLLQWLAVQTALDDLPPALAAWNGRIPFFIRLRQFAETEFPGPPAWATASLPALAGGIPAGWVNRQLDDGRALVLIDGIDEVPEERRGSSIAGSRCSLIQWAQVRLGRLRLASGMTCCASNIEAWPSVWRNIASGLPAVVSSGGLRDDRPRLPRGDGFLRAVQLLSRLNRPRSRYTFAGNPIVAPPRYFWTEENVVIVRTRGDVSCRGQTVEWGNGQSHRFLVEGDGMGFTLTETIVEAGSESRLRYERHLEACYCFEGEGEVLVGDDVFPIRPGTMYAPDLHDAHVLKATTRMRLICVFLPALRGDEAHRLSADGYSSY